MVNLDFINSIAVRGGHNFQATGAVSYNADGSVKLNETKEDRYVKDAVIKYLRSAGKTVYDVTPPNCDVNTDLWHGVHEAEIKGVDLFVSIHFDNAYDEYEGALGTATWICGNGGNAEKVARNIVNNVAEGTGLHNRGVCVNPRLYELRKPSMPSVIVETCFCESDVDVSIYREKGYDLIGKLIAEGILGRKLDETVGESESEVEVPSTNSKKEAFMNSTNARALVNLDPRDRASSTYEDLGEIYENERFKVLPEVCDKGNYLPIQYWRDGINSESQKVWVSANQKYMMIDTYHRVFNVITELDARYEPKPDSDTMGFVTNGERLYVHKTEGNYALCTYFAGNGYKTAWFTKAYLELV